MTESGDSLGPTPDGTRRLAAILFADIAGYTELSSHDEDLALALIKSFQRISRKIVGEKNGRVVKFLGDGLLAEFSSLDAAVNAAHALQHSFRHLDEVKESHAALRVGVHLGDIVFGEDGDVYGSGVNVASRIEGHAPLAGVVVSESAYQQLRHRRHFEFSSIGEKELKGVPDPMELYVVLLADPDAPQPALRVPMKRAPGGARRLFRRGWVVLGVPVIVAAVAVALDLGGIQAQVDRFLVDLGLSAVFDRPVTAGPPGFRAIEGGADVGGSITIAFSAAIDPATATSSSVQLIGPAGARVAAEVSALGDASSVEVTPRARLEFGTRYRVVLTDALRSAQGGEVVTPAGAESPEGLFSFVTQPPPPDPPVLASADSVEEAVAVEIEDPVPVPTGPGRLTIQVVPASLAPRTLVVIDGDTLGPAPLENRVLAEGVAHRIEIFGKPEFSARLIRIYDGEQTLAPAQRFTLRAQVTPFGTVSIDSTPGGTVFVDGQEIGSTALVTYPVTAGTVHTLEIRPLPADEATHGPYVVDFRVELLEDKSLGRIELPAR